MHVYDSCLHVYIKFEVCIILLRIMIIMFITFTFGGAKELFNLYYIIK